MWFFVFFSERMLQKQDIVLLLNCSLWLLQSVFSLSKSLKKWILWNTWKKSYSKYCRFQKCSYLCNRNREINLDIGLWCNGNTTDSGPVIPGSNPGSPTKNPCWFFSEDFFVVITSFGRYLLCIDTNHPLFLFLGHRQ